MTPHRPRNGRLTAVLAYAVFLAAVAFVAYAIWWM